MRPLGFAQIAFGIIALVAEIAFAGSGPVLMTPVQGILAASFALLMIISGVLLIRQKRTGAVLSAVVWGIQSIQVISPAFLFDFVLGPSIRLRWLPNRTTLSIGASFASAAFGSSYVPAQQHEFSINFIPFLVIAYLLRKRTDKFQQAVAGGLTSP